MSNVSTLAIADRIAIANELLAGTTVAPIVVPAPVVKVARQPKAVKGGDWRVRPASNRQCERIANAEMAILDSGRKRGIKLITRNMGEFANAGAASDYYRTLTAFMALHGIRYSA